MSLSINNDLSCVGVNYPGVQRLVSKGEVVLTKLTRSVAKLKKKDLFTSVWFWENMLTDTGKYNHTESYCTTVRLVYV
jgi:hypothetical protein